MSWTNPLIVDFLNETATTNGGVDELTTSDEPLHEDAFVWSRNARERRWSDRSAYAVPND